MIETKTQFCGACGIETAFEETEALQELMKIAGNVKSENLHISRDDGVTQEATVRAGVASVETKEIPRSLGAQRLAKLHRGRATDGLVSFATLAGPARHRARPPPCHRCGLVAEGDAERQNLPRPRVERQGLHRPRLKERKKGKEKS